MTLYEFHHVNGWHFLRLDDGSVRIRLERPFTPDITHTIRPNEWASIVAAVAPNHGSAEEHAAAEQLHAARTDPTQET